MSIEDNEPLTANDADRIEQQQAVGEDSVEDVSEQPLEAGAREANEADVVEQAQAVYGEDDYPRGPVGDESV
ncbi:hypothetical protein ASH00_03935 [Arthrobacter sp. Soil782]|uniref:hypothetical protein n=1 Tax=Arthrobacter sp. Soil782 TaxID=1736410 RepID=UPI0006F4BC02|nr:hypothetical protein [Arthrobacter sp. Soil782]KRF08842.1 hypothetical protein ASH00_03935 [Arthrobacter sp. Soil782]